MSNCSIQGKAAMLPTLYNTKVILLPRIKTSKIEPLDAGIFALVESRFRRASLYYIVVNIDRSRKCM